MTATYTTLLVIHILAGTATLIAACVAITSKWADAAHRWHILSGRLFFYGMTGIFISALGLSIIRLNLMLFVSIFSFYFAWMGLRYARNRLGKPSRADAIVIPVMTVVFAAMILYGLYALYAQQESFGIVIIVFGVIGVINAYGDWKPVRQGGAKGKQRIVEHLGKMLGGTIAAVTAFLVINISFEPAIVVWLLPTFVLTPLIILWARKIRGTCSVRGWARCKLYWVATGKEMRFSRPPCACRALERARGKSAP